VDADVVDALQERLVTVGVEAQLDRRDDLVQADRVSARLLLHGLVEPSQRLDGHFFEADQIGSDPGDAEVVQRRLRILGSPLSVQVVRHSLLL
jgi:hypothetical protein